MNFLIALLFLAMATTAPGAMLRDGGIPLLNDAERSDVDNGNQKGDLFTVTASETVQAIQWWGIYGFSNTPQTTDFFKARIYAVVSGIPNSTPLFEYTLPSVTRQATTGKVAGFLTVYSFTSTIPDTMLGPGNYVLSLMNDTTADTNDSWFWANSNVTGTAFERNSIADAWSQFKLGDGVTPVPSHAFNLSGFLGVPEPTTLGLLAVTGFGLATQRRRRR